MQKNLLLYVLVGFSQCDAARSKVGEARSIAHVMGEISSMLEDRGYTTKVLTSLQQVAGQQTPASFSQILETLINDLETKVESTIKASHESDQDALSNAIQKLQTDTATALAQKENADASDTDWFNCVGEEKAKLALQEAATISLAEAELSAVSPCEEKDRQGSTPFIQDLALPTFSCSVSETGSCTSALNQFKTVVDGMILDMEDDLNATQSAYNKVSAECDSAHAEIIDQENVLSSASQNFATQRMECLQMHEVRQTQMCLFGHALQVKCGAATDFTSLFTSTALSEVARRDEWKTVSVTKCMLQEVLVGHELTDDALSACEGAVLYHQDVGELETFDSEYEADVASLACGANVTFSGQTWETGSTSDTYTVIEFHPTFDVSNPLAPFDLCVAGVAPTPAPPPTPTDASISYSCEGGCSVTFFPSETMLATSGFGTEGHALCMSTQTCVLASYSFCDSTSAFEDMVLGLSFMSECQRGCMETYTCCWAPSVDPTSFETSVELTPGSCESIMETCISSCPSDFASEISFAEPALIEMRQSAPNKKIGTFLKKMQRSVASRK